MAHIYKRHDSKYWWVGYQEGGRNIQKSLKVTSKKSAELLLAEYQLGEAKEYNKNSKVLIINKDIKSLFDEFISNRLVRNRTKDWYNYSKNCFIKFCQSDGRSIEKIKDINISVIEDFYNERKKTTREGAKSNIRALKSFMNYAVERGYIYNNPAKKVKTEKTVKKIFKSLSFEEIDAILGAAKKNAPAYYPIFAAAYYTGFRLNELLHLELSDVNICKGYIHLRSKPENPIKDYQERIIPLNNKLKKILTNIEPQGKWLLVSGSKKTMCRRLNHKLRQIAALCGIKPEGMHMHVFRETFGSHLRLKEVDIALISQYMGHSSIDVTLRHYAHISIQQTHSNINLL